MTGPREFDTTGAAYFDGETPTPRPVLRLALEGDALVIGLPGGVQVIWPAVDIRKVPDGAGRGDAVLRWTGDPLARLFTPNALVVGALPRPDRRAPPRGRVRMVAWAGAAVLAVALQIGVLIPIMADQLATFIPPAGERALGDATLGQIREVLDETGLEAIPFCTEEDGVRALAKMEARLSETLDTEQTFSVHVLDHEMINAFALPGGYIVFFRGLIDAAATPEEVAAVFAHEMGHVVSRDPTRHALRTAGSIGILGLLFGDFAGGAVMLFLAEQLINAQYTQGAEAVADDFATDVLLRAKVSPGALGDFFERLRSEFGDSEGFVSHFLSHPSLGDRIAAARAAVPVDASFVPVLTASEWQALQTICPRRF